MFDLTLSPQDLHGDHAVRTSHHVELPYLSHVPVVELSPEDLEAEHEHFVARSRQDADELGWDYGFCYRTDHKAFEGCARSPEGEDFYTGVRTKMLQAEEDGILLAGRLAREAEREAYEPDAAA